MRTHVPQPPRPSEWPFVEVDVEAAYAEDIGAALLDLGSTGIEEKPGVGGQVTLVAWFAATPDLSELAAGLAASGAADPGTARSAAASLRAGSVPDDDWLRLWKRGFEPTRIGIRLLVYPSWKRDEAMAIDGRLRIEVDPGMAFGTGTHETTRLCLEWLDAHWTGGSLLDVGTGTGILAIAAVLLGPGSRIAACDVDDVAVDVARDNARLNGVAGEIPLCVGGPGDIEGEFDVVVANLTADVIDAVRLDLADRTRTGGMLVLSGVLAEQADRVTRAIVELGFTPIWRRAAGEWVALALRRQ